MEADKEGVVTISFESRWDELQVDIPVHVPGETDMLLYDSRSLQGVGELRVEAKFAGQRPGKLTIPSYEPAVDANRIGIWFLYEKRISFSVGCSVGSNGPAVDNGGSIWNDTIGVAQRAVGTTTTVLEPRRPTTSHPLEPEGQLMNEQAPTASCTDLRTSTDDAIHRFDDMLSNNPQSASPRLEPYERPYASGTRSIGDDVCVAFM